MKMLKKNLFWPAVIATITIVFIVGNSFGYQTGYKDASDSVTATYNQKYANIPPNLIGCEIGSQNKIVYTPNQSDCDNLKQIVMDGSKYEQTGPQTITQTRILPLPPCMIGVQNTMPCTYMP